MTTKDTGTRPDPSLPLREYLAAVEEWAKRQPRLVVDDNCPPEKREQAQALADKLNADPEFCAEYDAMDADFRARVLSTILWGESDG